MIGETLEEWLSWVECRARREDSCLVWLRAFNNGESPQTCLETPEGRKISILIRRKLWELKNGRPPRRSYVVIAKCGTHGCVEPEHLREMSRSLLQRGKAKSVEHRMALTKAARERKSNKLTQEAVNDIRYGEGTVVEKAQRYGITTDYVCDVLAHRCWKDISGPFAGLFAANDGRRRVA